MKLNLGCGYNKLDGYVNVDHDVLCKPDVVADLEERLPFDDNSVDEIILNHVLEHLGQTTKSYFAIWKELYRVLKGGGELKITVPHWNHENFHHDPTHVRKVTPNGVAMFDQERNMEQVRNGGQETTLGLQLGIDVEVTGVAYDPTPWFHSAMQNQSREIIEREMNRWNNACFQVHIYAQAHKPARHA